MSIRAAKRMVRRVAGMFVDPVRINDTAPYQLYLRVCHRRHWKNMCAEKQFYATLLEQVGNDLVFDIGANAGHKAIFFAAVAKTTICMEPDPSAVAILKARFSHRQDIEIVAKGVGECGGEAEFIRLEEAGPLNTFSPKWAAHSSRLVRSPVSGETTLTVEITTLDEAIKAYGLPNYIKIDVEGFELPVLRGLSKVVPLASFECNLPVFQDETVESILLLRNLSPRAYFNWMGDDGHSLASPIWVSADQMIETVRSNRSGYLEIFCSTRPLHVGS